MAAIVIDGGFNTVTIYIGNIIVYILYSVIVFLIGYYFGRKKHKAC